MRHPHRIGASTQRHMDRHQPNKTQRHCNVGAVRRSSLCHLLAIYEAVRESASDDDDDDNDSAASTAGQSTPDVCR